MPVLYPDVIKLDLRLLDDRAPEDVARIVTAVGAEAERRHATVLAEGIDSEEQLATARAYGRHARPGLPARRARLRCPTRCRSPGRPLRLPGGGGDPFGVDAVGAGDELAPPARARAGWPRRAARADHRPRGASSARPRWCSPRSPTRRRGAALDALRLAARAGRVRRRAQRRRTRSTAAACAAARSRADDPLRGTGTLVALAPELRGLLRRRAGPATDEWSFAITYDRETVVECALPLMARMEPLDR